MRSQPHKNSRAGTRISIIAILMVTLMLSACGYRGPLYLPDDPLTGQSSDAPVTTENTELDSEEEDEEEGKPGH